MITTLNDPVDYYLPLDDHEIHLNPHIGHRIQLAFLGQIRCSHCGRASKKSFSQGYCYPCFKKLPQCDLCMVSPERCHFDQGTCRDPEWGKDVCHQPHIVYLANSSGIKVGITKLNQIPTRWIDQGAIQAMPVLRVSTRQQSGLAEVIFKQHVADKTHWQRMLKGGNPELDLIAVRDEIMCKVAPEIEALQQQFGLQAIQPVVDQRVQAIHYPVQQFPTKVKSLNFDKTPVIEGVLLGIKGQYLIFDNGVINLRKFSSYEIKFERIAAQTN